MSFINTSNTWRSADSISPLKVVESLIADMKHAAFKVRSVEAFESASDSLTCFAAAHLVPSIESNWREYGLTRQQAAVADLLHSKMNRLVTNESLMNALYFDRPDDAPSHDILKVVVCKVRQKIKGSPYVIETIWGQGFRMVSKPKPESIAA
jgi:DNA-binding response OmpR family regulator